VSEVRGLRELAVTGGSRGSAVTVLTRGPVGVDAGRPVQITATVGQLHTASPSDRLPYLQQDLYPAGGIEAYPYDVSVEPLP
jgi:hypothetical protein